MTQAADELRAAPRLRGRRWRPKRLDIAADDSREWLIWSCYWKSWHRRSESGGAVGYTSNILDAGIFETRKAREYHCGARDRAIHVSKQAAAIRKQSAALQARHAREQSDLAECLALFDRAIAAAEAGE